MPKNATLDSVLLPSRWERWCQLGQYPVAGGKFDKCLAGFGQALMVAAEAAPSADPGERALDDPSSRKRAEAGGKELFSVHLLSLRHEQAAFGHGECAHGLHRPAEGVFEPANERTPIMAISPQQLHSGKESFQGQEQVSASGLVRDLGSCHFHVQQMALGVHQSVALASPNFSQSARPSLGREPRCF